jgi:hypothetical protein
MTAPIKYDYYTYEVTSINNIDISITFTLSLSYLTTMDVFGNIRIYELITFPYEYYQNFIMFVSLGITGKESKAGLVGV